MKLTNLLFILFHDMQNAFENIIVLLQRRWKLYNYNSPGPNDPAFEAPGVEADVAEVTRVSYRKRVGLTCSKMKTSWALISDLIFCVYIFLWWRCYPLSDRRQSDHSQCREFLDWQPMKLTLHWTLTQTLRMTGKDHRTHSKRTTAMNLFM